jgi:hypothetical protein
MALMIWAVSIYKPSVKTARLQGATSQETAIFMLVDVRT